MGNKYFLGISLYFDSTKSSLMYEMFYIALKFHFSRYSDYSVFRNV